MDTFKQFILKAQTTKKCPPGYRFDEKLGVCVPVHSRGYPYLGTTSKTANGDANNNTQNGTNGNGNGNGANGGNGAGGNGGGNGGSSSGGGN
tara:strand:+ start:533 stop:808 length:276 start_codon:yes stop_codon:yes gene_type:complete